MHDIKFIKNNQKLFDQSLINRNLKAQSSEIITLHKKYTEKLLLKENLQEQRNIITTKIRDSAKIKSINTDHLKNKVKAIKNDINELESLVIDLKSKLDDILFKIPNLLDSDVPVGLNESNNQVIKKIDKKINQNFKLLNHLQVAENLNQIHYNEAVKLSGAKFSILSSSLALLSRALINFMLDNHTNNNYEEYLVPELVKDDALFGTGQLPKFKEDLFQTSNNLWLIPTSEVCLVNINREKILNFEDLPLRYTTFTNCFRSEAGSAGQETKGLIREHQFGKVELVSITEPKNSDDELDRMMNLVESILIKLDLSYKIVKLCSGDVGFSSSKTFDFEIWLPGQKKYMEISSCSNCREFQARRMKMRIKNEKEKSIIFPHTLNGSGLAIGRAIVAILESYQQEDGSVIIPEVLKKYMGGQTKILKK